MREIESLPIAKRLSAISEKAVRAVEADGKPALIIGVDFPSELAIKAMVARKGSSSEERQPDTPRSWRGEKIRPRRGGFDDAIRQALYGQRRARRDRRSG